MGEKRNSTAADSVQGEFVITRVFNTPRDLVFKAWIDPRHLAQWWGPRGFTNPVCEANSSPGGAIRIDMRAPDGTVYSLTGVYREIVEPEKLVFREALERQGNFLFELLNTITFTERDGKTTLKLTARVVRAATAARQFVDGMEPGWTESLERLETDLSKMSVTTEEPMQIPTPDPALKRLERLVGTWDIKGRTPDSKENNITGRMTCEWLPGGFFLKQSSEIHFKNFKMQSLEIIGYDPSSDTFPSSVYSSTSGVVLPYHWNVQGNTVTHWKATDKYTGTFSENGRTLTGGWRPIDGHLGGVTYDAVMNRLD